MKMTFETNSSTTKRLTPLLARVEEILILNDSVNTLKFRRLGIYSPAQCIKELKARGLIIEKTTQKVTDELGNEHPRVAFYKLKGGK